MQTVNDSLYHGPNPFFLKGVHVNFLFSKE